MSAPVIHRVGTRSLLVDLPDLKTVMSWYAGLQDAPLPGQIEAIPAARTVLLTTLSSRHARDAARALSGFRPAPVRRHRPREVTIEVCYDGADLTELAAELGIGTEELIAWHSGQTWLGAFGGFAPGFSYCVPENAAKARDIPRRSSPRTSVPAGSVGLAGAFSAVYPGESPGGWRLIGRTATAMWDADAESPALVRPGDRVRYLPVREQVALPRVTRPRETDSSSRPTLRIDDPGMLTLIEDRGRKGRGDLGVTGSGAADRAAALAANTAVGNGAGAGVLEIIGGLRATALADTVIALAGAPAPATIDGRDLEFGRAAALRAGSILELGTPVTGMRSYLGVRGGVVVPRTLDSVSTDVLSGLGPPPVSAGDTLSSAPRPRGVVNPTVVNPVRVHPEHGTTRGVLRCVPGPRDDWFAGGVHRLAQGAWTISDRSNRVGLRLEPGEGRTGLHRNRTGELPSEGMVAGSIQVPPGGDPVVLLRDHAVTGGYPVIATVIEEDLDIAAQLPPGGRVSFLPVHPDDLTPLEFGDAASGGTGSGRTRS